MFLNPLVDKSVLTSSKRKCYQNLTGTMVFTIVFRIQCSFFIVLSFDWKFVDLMIFSILHSKMCGLKNLAHLRGFAT